jgi:hypothetical protein
MMNTEFISFSTTRESLMEIHRAMLARFFMENALRREQGLEPIDQPPLLENLEKTLGLSTEEAHALSHQLEDELWAFNWYSYTDEWAWFRAKQDTLKELGEKAKRTKRETLERLIERRYQEHFDRYVKEIDMQENATKRKAQPKKK